MSIRTAGLFLALLLSIAPVLAQEVNQPPVMPMNYGRWQVGTMIISGAGITAYNVSILLDSQTGKTYWLEWCRKDPKTGPCWQEVPNPAPPTN